jgi:hypothetical protein
MSNKVFPSRLQALCRCGAPGLVCCGDTVPLTVAVLRMRVRTRERAGECRAHPGG